MIIFKTERLDIRQILPEDKSFFQELTTDPDVLRLIPQQPFTQEEVDARFTLALKVSDPLIDETSVWGVFEDGKDELIGLCALLTNDEGDRELGYRFRKQFWGIGYGTEVTKGLIDYCFKELNDDYLTADVNVENVGSVKILDKFLSPVREFFNEKDQSTDRRYELRIEDYEI